MKKLKVIGICSCGSIFTDMDSFLAHAENIERFKTYKHQWTYVPDVLVYEEVKKCYRKRKSTKS